MNDYMEHSWLRKIVLEKLQALQAGITWSILDPPEKHIPSRFYTAVQTQLRTVSHVDPYCICFSADGDVLSQWRAYADDGAGFAIGFNPDSLKNFPNNTELRRVNYDIERHNAHVEKLISACVGLLKPGTTNEDMKNLASDFHGALLGESIVCKNPKFSEEQEWRVVHEPIYVDVPSIGKELQVGPAAASGFRIRGKELLHYLDLNFDPGFAEKSIIEIVLGPKNPARNTLDSFRLFLDQNNLKHAKIRISEATYR